MDTVRGSVREGLAVAVKGCRGGTRGVPSFGGEPIVVKIDLVGCPFATRAGGGREG